MNVNWHLSVEDSLLVLSALDNWRPFASTSAIQDRYDYLWRQLGGLVKTAQSHDNEVAIRLGPEFSHDCRNCLFLGRFLEWDTNAGRVNPEHYDLYMCRRRITEWLEHVELLARYGDEGPEYYCTSFNPASQATPQPSSLSPLREAYARYQKQLAVNQLPAPKLRTKLTHMVCPFCDQDMTRTQFLSHRIHGAFDPATLVDELEGTVKGCASHMERSHLP